MIKVFLVEDEFVVREGIKKNIDWSAHGYDFCGEASDGELAYPLIQKLRPEIVITDIRMPFMDGLELSRLIKKELPQTEIIILSGFEEFEYAKEAINLGVAQYLTKPINSEDLLREIDLLSEKIKAGKEEASIMEKYLVEMQENTLKDKLALFNDLVIGGKSTSGLMDEAKRLNLDISAVWYNIVLIAVQSTHHEMDEFSRSEVEISAKISEYLVGKRIIIFDRNIEGYAFLAMGDSREEVESLTSSCIDSFKKLLNNYSHVRYFGGIGECVNRLSELPLSYSKASHAFAQRFFTVQNDFVSCKNAAMSDFDNFDIESIDPNQLDKDRLVNFLKYGNVDESVFFVDEYVNSVGANALNSVVFRQYVAMDTYFIASRFAKGISCPEDSVTPPDIGGSTTATSESCIEYLTQVIKEVLCLRDNKSTDRYSEIVNEAIKFIEENYTDEELSLNTLASHVNVSPNHLSMIFSQHTQQTFIKYLTDLRISKAKELLKCSGKRSSEIALEVGYKDPHRNCIKKIHT